MDVCKKAIMVNANLDFLIHKIFPKKLALNNESNKWE
jgi:hypothetical protein